MRKLNPSVDRRYARIEFFKHCARGRDVSSQPYSLHHYTPAERPYPEVQENEEGDAQSQYYPTQGKSRQCMSVKTGNHGKTQSLCGIGERVEERYNLEPPDGIKCAPWIIRTTRKD
jgi:hypothetical protein